MTQIDLAYVLQLAGSLIAGAIAAIVTGVVLIFSAGFLFSAVRSAWRTATSQRRQVPSDPPSAAEHQRIIRVEEAAPLSAHVSQRAREAEQGLRVRHGGHWPAKVSATSTLLVARDVRRRGEAVVEALDKMAAATADATSTPAAVGVAQLRVRVTVAELMAAALVADRFAEERAAAKREARPC